MCNSTCLLVALSGAILSAQPATGLRLQVLSGPALVVSTEATETVVFQVIDGSSPVGGVMVTLSAPTEGSSGRFPESESRTGTLHRVVTDAGGIASTQFVVNTTPGWFRLDATLEGEGDLTASIAFSVFRGTPPPALSKPAEVRAEWMRELGPLGSSALLHGPWLVPAGAEVDSAGKAIPARNGLPRILSRPSWVLWHEDNFRLGFGHRTRIMVAPSLAAPAAGIKDASIHGSLWWPRVRHKEDAAFHSLGSSHAGHPDLNLEQHFPTFEDAAGITQKLVRNAAPSNACAIFIQGPKMKGSLKTMGVWARYLFTSMKVPGENMFIRSVPSAIGSGKSYPTTTENDLRRMIKEAAERGCKKVYLILHAHGEKLGFYLGTEQSQSFVPWEQLAFWMKDLQGAEICALIGACFSGNAIAAFRGQGLKGDIVTDADENNSSLTTSEGSVFLLTLASFLNRNPNVTVTDAASLLATDKALANRVLRENGFPTPDGGSTPFPIRFSDGASSEGFELFPANPKVEAIDVSSTRTFVAPDFYVHSPGPSEVQFPYVPGMPEGLKFVVNVSDGTIARTTTPEVIASERQTSAGALQFSGLDCGITQYELKGRDSLGREWVGRGFVQVGEFSLSSKALRLRAGESVKVAVEPFRPLDRPGTFLFRIAEREIAGVSRPVIDMGSVLNPNTSPTEITVTGVSPGQTQLEVIYSIGKQSFFKSIPAEVVVDVQKQSLCDDRYTGNVTWFVRSGEIHTNFVQMPTSTPLNLSVNGPVATLLSSIPQVVPAQGIFNCNAGSGTLSGRSTSPVAGRSAVPGVYTIGNFRPFVANGVGMADMTIQYELGKDVFPQEPIVFRADARLTGRPVCTYTLTPNRLDVNSTAGSRTVKVSTQGGCAWQATTATAWIQLVQPALGTGSGSFAFHYAANPGAARLGGILVAGENSEVRISQSAAGQDRPEISRVVVAGSRQFGFAPASLVHIEGINLSQTSGEMTGADVAAGNLPITLHGVSVSVGGKPAAVTAVSPSRVTIVAPDTVDPGLVSVAVTNQRGPSDPLQTVMFPLRPSLFQQTGPNSLFAAATHSDGAIVAPRQLGGGAREAAPGDIVRFEGTGFGETNPATPAGRVVAAPAELTPGVSARIGDVDAEVILAVKTGPGIYRIDVKVPPLPDGNHEVRIFSEGVPAQPVLVPILNR